MTGRDINVLVRFLVRDDEKQYDVPAEESIARIVRGTSMHQPLGAARDGVGLTRSFELSKPDLFGCRRAACRRGEIVYKMHDFALKKRN